MLPIVHVFGNNVQHWYCKFVIPYSLKKSVWSLRVNSDVFCFYNFAFIMKNTM